MNKQQRSTFLNLEKPRFSRKAQIVEIIAIAIAAAVIIFGVWPVIKAKLTGAGSTAECNLSLFLSALTKVVSLGIAERPPECEIEFKTVGDKEIKQMKSRAAERTKNYYKDTTPYYNQARTFFKIDSMGIPFDDSLNEWALDAIIGGKMAECWNKVWHGSLNIFKHDWWPADKSLCIVCTVIRFNEDLPVSLRNRRYPNEIKSLYAWMNAEPYFSTNYYEFISEGLTIKPDEKYLSYITTPQRQLAIAYMETKTDLITALLPTSTGGKMAAAGANLGAWAAMETYVAAKKALGLGVVEDVKQLLLVPFDELGSRCIIV